MIKCCDVISKVPRGKSLTTLLPWDVQLVAKNPAEDEFPALKYKT